MKRLYIITYYLLLALAADAQMLDAHTPTGQYLGQKPPGTTPEIFAPGIVSTNNQEHSSLVISPDGKEMWWSRWRLPLDYKKYPQEIVFIKYENEKWTEPKTASFSGKYRDGSPALSSDGKKIFFYSNRPMGSGSSAASDNNIWFVERTNDGWSMPLNPGQDINSPYSDALPSLAANGNLYFVSDRIKYEDPTGDYDLFMAKYVNGKYLKPESISNLINTSYAREAFHYVASDESYIIFNRDSRKFDKNGNVTTGIRILMISFRDRNGSWCKPIDMGPDFYNTRFPSLSPDGRYLFFTKYSENSNEDFYWVSAKIIEELRLKE